MKPKQETIKQALEALYYVQAHLGGSEEQIGDAIKDLELNLKI